MILRSGIIDPFETQIRVVRNCQKLLDMDYNSLLRPQYSLEATNVSEVLLTSFNTHVPDVLTEVTINESFRDPETST